LTRNRKTATPPPMPGAVARAATWTDSGRTVGRLRLSSGMLLIVLVLVGLCTIGLVAAVRTRRILWRVAAATVALLAGGRLVIGIVSEVLVQVDLNPVVRSEELVGLWRQGTQTLSLSADHTFELRGPTTLRGKWELDDWNLSLDLVYARVIKANGAYRIVVSFPDDPDLWDGRFGFARESGR
jgi:hypothetical protein